MFERKRIAFAVALIMATCVTGICVVAITRSRSAAAAPMKVRVIRRKDRKHDKPKLEEVSAQQTPEERKLKVRKFKDMPVTVKEVRNLQSEEWYKDLEIEVKNTSDRPIYRILAYLDFPDDKNGVRANEVSGVLLHFGLNKYLDLTIPGNASDAHLNPGETFVLTVPQQYRKGLRVQSDRSPEYFRKLEFHFGTISFGDGTGFEAETPRDFRSKKTARSITRQVRNLLHAHRRRMAAVRAAGTSPTRNHTKFAGTTLAARHAIVNS